MSYRTLHFVSLGLSGLALLGGLAVAALAHRDTERAWVHRVPPTVVSEAASVPISKVRAWFSVIVTLGWAVLLFLVIYLAATLWCFVCRVAYADSDLLQWVGRIPAGDNPIPRPDQLPLEGD